jgi:hypothetical protein
MLLAATISDRRLQRRRRLPAVRDAARQVVKRHSLTSMPMLMPNHFRLLLEVGRVPLSKAMQVLLYHYTRGYNQRYRKSGQVFQARDCLATLLISLGLLTWEEECFRDWK